MIQQAEFIERKNCINCHSDDLKELASGRFIASPVREFLNVDGDASPTPFLQEDSWSFVQCQHCQQKFHKYILSPRWNEIRFSEWMTQEAMEQHEARNQKPDSAFLKAKKNKMHILRLQKLTHAIQKNNKITILDFGCGWGNFLSQCAQFGFDCYGIDRSSARRNKNTTIKIFPDLASLKSENPEIKFHVVTLFEVLEHLDAPLEVLQKLHTVMEPGSILILETPNCHKTVNICSERDFYNIHPLDHINAFSPHTQKSIAERAGFVRISRPVAHVTCSPLEVIKNQLRPIAENWIRPRTQQYFRKI